MVRRLDEAEPAEESAAARAREHPAETALPATFDATIHGGAVEERERPPAKDAPPLPPRYRDLGRIARGAFGEVRRVHDGELDRAVAMKLLRPEIAASQHAAARFAAEMRLTAGLSHPGIVAVLDGGTLADGRLWFTMPEVRGRTLTSIIEEVHAAATAGGFAETASGFTFRRLVDAFARVCQAVAYAHRRGVVHRDLKPDNVMIGELGEAMVMDWGLAQRRGERAMAGDIAEERGSGDAGLTRHGEALGTPAFMPPEQARGDLHLHGPASDVYALGAMLYQVLTGVLPYRGTAQRVLAQVIAGPPPPVREAAPDRLVPVELADACARAMARDIADRYPDAEALAREVVTWLDGAKRRDQALLAVASVRALVPAIAALHAKKAALEAEAHELLSAVRPFDPVEAKAAAWDLQEEATRLGREAALEEAAWLAGMHGALCVDPDLAEAHQELADHYVDRLLSAERGSRDEDAVRFEVLVRTHDRGRHAGLLRGEGALSLRTDPEGATVSLHRYVPERRRLVLRHVMELGPTPILEATLPRGSYLCVVRAPGHAETRIPVLIERGRHWDGVPPGETESLPIPLPREGELGWDDIYVPAGWCWTGGDPQASDSLPAQRIWIDGFVLGRYPVTNRQYLIFLNDLIRAGREDEALLACPRDPPSLSGATDARAGRLVYARGAGGELLLAGEEFGRRWREDWPAALIDWHGASAYARWLAERTGEPWRLPSELEREKAARGADARLFPWGNQADPTFARTAESDSLPMRVGVTEYPADEGPCGARGLAGNMRDYCLEVWRHGGPKAVGGRLSLSPAAAGDPDFRANRGGAWTSPLERSRAAARFGNLPTDRRESIGVRVARGFGR